MATRSTPLPVVVALALAATATLAVGAHACDSAKSASAMPACGAVKARTASAVAKPAVTPPAAGTAAALPALVSPTAAPAPAPFASLPNFAQPVVAGLMAFIDPETGMLSGPIGELQVPGDLSNAFGPTPDLTPTPLPGGGFVVDLQGTLQDYYVLTIDPLGRRSIRCVQDARQAHMHTHTHAAPIAPAPTTLLPIAER